MDSNGKHLIGLLVAPVADEELSLTCFPIIIHVQTHAHIYYTLHEWVQWKRSSDSSLIVHVWFCYLLWFGKQNIQVTNIGYSVNQIDTQTNRSSDAHAHYIFNMPHASFS